MHKAPTFVEALCYSNRIMVPEARLKLLSAAARQACQSSLALNLSQTTLTKCGNPDAKKPQLSLRLYA
ncbi:hypothetical protein, partial [Shewanella sp.]|uniref:hypothetical protein n=1 Tax=Shewanella sp. TaxID=50422 RepID=UPI00262104AD